MPSPTRRNRASVGPPLLSADCACCGGATGANARSLPAPNDGHAGGPARHRHRAEGGGGGAVAELPGSIGTPAVWRAARGHTAGVTAPRADRGEAEPARDRRSRRGVHEDKAAGAECTTRAGAPTVRHAARGHTASVCTTRTDRCKREAAQHCSRRVRRPGSRAAAAAVASLPVGTHAPTVRGAVCRHAAYCRTAPRTGAREHQSTPHRQRARPGERLLWSRIHPALPAPERTPEVVAPAVRRAVRGDRKSVV